MSSDGQTLSMATTLPGATAGAWTRRFADDFDRSVAEGHFLDGANYANTPAAAARGTTVGALTSDGRYRVYRKGWKDTSGRGTYSPEIASIASSKLRVHIQTVSGEHRVFACTPEVSGADGWRSGLLSQLAVYRIRADLMPTYKGVPMFWADDALGNALLLTYGEIDWFEANFDKRPSAFLHHTGSTSFSDQDYFPAPAGTTWQDWHTVVTEWVAGTSCDFYMDGVHVGRTTTRIPNNPMHFNFQFETNLSQALAIDSSVSGYVEIDWVALYGLGGSAPDPGPDPDPIDDPDPPAPDPVPSVEPGRPSPHVISLGWETDQYDLRTRVKVRGPLTTLKNAWSELWRTSKFHLPVGLWYDSTDSANLRVLDRGTKRLYKLRQSDRTILSSVYLGGVCAHPLGLSGDPASSTVYWVLEAPWRTTGVTSGNQILKLRKSDNHVLARWAIPDGRWSAIKVSSGFIWLTNLDTDKVYKRSKTDGSSIASYSIKYDGTTTFPQTGLGTTQTNPSGLMIDGSTLFYFFANGGTTARFLTADVSAPRTLTGVVKTAGTQLHGGEMDTTTHTECYGDSDSLGLVAKFTLREPVEHDVAQEAINVDLEDELGALAQIEDRIHDAHPLDAAHPFQIRRETMSIEEVESMAQAMQVAQERLAELDHRREVLDVGIVGNPALQKGDLVSVDDPLVGITVYGRIDTLETDMSADQPYVGVAAIIPQDVVIADDITVADDSVDDGAIDENGTPDTSDPGPDD